MNKRTEKFIIELKELFIKHDVYLGVYEDYGDNEIQLGNHVEINSHHSEQQQEHINLIDMRLLSNMINYPS